MIRADSLHSAPIARSDSSSERQPAPLVAGADRIVWPDIARGIGIILVVIGHSIGGMVTGGMISHGSLLDLIFSAIYTFHMPLFFVLSGIFIQDSLLRGQRQFIRTALGRIAYPYFVWGFIQLATIVALGQTVNAPQQGNAFIFIAMLWSPPSQYWFLYVLFAYQIAAVLFARFSTPSVMLVVALAARIVPEFVELPAIVETLLKNWVYFAIAVRYADLFKDKSAGEAPADRSLAALVLAWIAAALVSYRCGGYLSAWNLPAAFFGTWAMFRISRIPRLPGTALLVYFGRRSMPIFLTHVLIVAGIRIVSVSVFKITEPLLILPVAVLAGLAIPVFFFDWAKRRNLATVLALR